MVYDWHYDGGHSGWAFEYSRGYLDGREKRYWENMSVVFSRMFPDFDKNNGINGTGKINQWELNRGSEYYQLGWGRGYSDL